MARARRTRSVELGGLCGRRPRPRRRWPECIRGGNAGLAPPPRAPPAHHGRHVLSRSAICGLAEAKEPIGKLAEPEFSCNLTGKSARLCLPGTHQQFLSHIASDPAPFNRNPAWSTGPNGIETVCNSFRSQLPGLTNSAPTLTERIWSFGCVGPPDAA